MDEITTIKVKKSTRDGLAKLKIHHRESFEELFQRILAGVIKDHDLREFFNKQ